MMSVLFKAINACVHGFVMMISLFKAINAVTTVYHLDDLILLLKSLRLALFCSCAMSFDDVRRSGFSNVLYLLLLTAELVWSSASFSLLVLAYLSSNYLDFP